MWSGTEFEYPSAAFFDKIETCAAALPLFDLKKAMRHFKKTNQTSIEQSLSDLLTRLKKEIALDFQEHESEADDVPYKVTYLVTLDGPKTIDCLRILTSLQAKTGQSGRVFYGATVFRVGFNQFLSNEYGN